jgi:hypothetical protein
MKEYSHLRLFLISPMQGWASGFDPIVFGGQTIFKRVAKNNPYDM